MTLVFISFKNSSWGFKEPGTECAARSPDPATAGTPIPGKKESPQPNKPFIGRVGKGKSPCPALIAGPYDPL
jgi:hypothetical protein